MIAVKPLEPSLSAATIVTLLSILTLLLPVSPSVSAADALSAQDCAQLTNRAARLACFDQIFGSAKPTEPVEAPAAANEETEETAAVTNEPAAVNPQPAAVVPEPDSAPLQTESDEPQLKIEDLVISVPQASTKLETEPAAAAGESTTDAIPQTGSGGILQRKTKVNFSSKIKAFRAKDKQRMVFLLENGEIWMQSAPRNLPIKEGEVITIKSGLMGGYILRTAKGVSTRVNRIK